MRKALYVLLLTAIALLGFTLGRITGIQPQAAVTQTNHVYPLPPPPPASKPYVPGVAVNPAQQPEQAIVIETPTDGASITGAFSVTGRAKADGKGKLMVDVKRSVGGLLFQGPLELQDDNGASYGRFQATVGPFIDATGGAVVEVYRLDDKGMETDKQSKNITFAKPDTVDVQVYFQNSKLDPTASCDLVFPVTRSVSTETKVYRAAIEALLAGPTSDESAKGYNTSLPEGVRLKSVGADANGTVTADFDSALDRGVAGSCRVTAIRDQIVRTLEQFPEVHDVVITVDGVKDTVLQP